MDNDEHGTYNGTADVGYDVSLYTQVDDNQHGTYDNNVDTAENDSKNVTIDSNKDYTYYGTRYSSVESGEKGSYNNYN